MVKSHSSCLSEYVFLLYSYSQRTGWSSDLTVIFFSQRIEDKFHCLLGSTDDSEKSAVNLIIDAFERILLPLMLLTSSLFSLKCHNFTVVCLHMNFSLFTLLGIQWTSGSEVWYLHHFYQVIGHRTACSPAVLSPPRALKRCASGPLYSSG